MTTTGASPAALISLATTRDSSVFRDINGDRTVNGLDLVYFRDAFGSQIGDAYFLGYLDFDADGVINGFDFGQFRIRFGVSLP